MASSETLVPDSFIRLFSEAPTKPFCWIAQVGPTDIHLSQKSRHELLQDALAAAAGFEACGLRKRLPGEPPVLVALLPHDEYDCFVAFLGVLLNRWTPVLISPRASSQTIIALIADAQAQWLLVDRSYTSSLVPNIQSGVPALHIAVIQDHARNPGDALLPIPATWTEDQTRTEMDQAAYYLHTSGSTGHPKLIPETHSQTLLRLQRIKPYPGHTVFSPTPIYHMTGLTMFLRFPFLQSIPIFAETNQPYTGELLCRILDKFPNTVTVVPPSLLEEIAVGTPAERESLAMAHRVMFAGAGLSPVVGDQLARAGVKLVSAFGTTETGQLTRADVASDDPLDWPYVRFLDYSQLTFVPAEESDGLFKLVVKPGRFLDVSLINSTEPYGFVTGDLWQRHPTIDDLWKHVGRIGCTTVLSTGLKVDNEHLESLIVEHPLVQDAIVFGEGRAQIGIIILPVSAGWIPSEVIDAVWPAVEHANSLIPSHSRLVRPLVLVADPKTRFALTAKSTVSRAETIAIYAREIDAAYAAVEEGTSSDSLPDICDHVGILKYIRQVVSEIAGKDVPDEADLFDSGLDSLTATFCRSRLIALFHMTRSEDDVPRNLVYHYPSIKMLYEFAISSPARAMTASAAQPVGLEQYFHKTYDSLHFASLAKSVQHGLRTDLAESGPVVVLTGSTGSFGSQVLIALLRSADVRAVHCFKRKDSLPPKILEDPSVLALSQPKIHLWDVDFTQDTLGLSDIVLGQLRSTVTHIVHCAWDVNFNYTLERFLDVQMTGLRNLVMLALSTDRPSRVYFLSSAAAVAHAACGNTSGGIPEQILSDPSLPLEQGYAQSKFIAERILAKASQETGLNVTIVRAGQLSGSTTTGYWNPKEYFPAMLATSLALGQIPCHLPDVRWVPTDVAADILLDIMLNDAASATSELLVRHIDNPAALSGKLLVEWLVGCSQGLLVPVPVEIWIQAVIETEKDVPAKRLLHFFEEWLSSRGDMEQLGVEGTRSVSSAIDRSGITRELVSKYFAATKEAFSI